MPDLTPVTEQTELQVTADEKVTILRHQLNAMPPCVLTSLDVFPHGPEIRWRNLPPAAGSVRIDFTGRRLAITPANLAAAIGMWDVHTAIASLIDSASGGAAGNCHADCMTVLSAVTGQAQRYPLDRPDLRRPEEGGPS